MLLGPITQSGFEHWNLYIQTQVRVRLQAVLTQLFFEHSLRIRMKAETSDDEGAQSAPTPLEADEDRSLAGGDSTASFNELGRQGHDETESQFTQASTAVGSTAASSPTQGTTEGSGQAKPKADEGPPVKKSSGDAENLIGRINNLVTSDLENIVEGCDFPSFSK